MVFYLTGMKMGVKFEISGNGNSELPSGNGREWKLNFIAAHL